MTRIFWLFRSNIKHLEYYHKYDTLEEFEKKCHDFYMLLPIWLLRHNYFDTVVVWRLSKNPPKEIDFNVDGKLYSQRWVRNFSEVYNYPNPQISLFRGGFKEYDDVTRIYPKKFGLKLYLGTGKRIYPQWGGNYNVYLQEDERDFRANHVCRPFYKTASPEIFYPYPETNIEPIMYDICWPCNFAQIRQKGQQQFIQAVSQSKYLQSLDIVHCGNKPAVGKRMCKQHGVTNIKFLGELDRPGLNHILNHSKFGLCMSNLQDGCPRVVTEILMSGTPLILSNLTRTLPYYKKKGVVVVDQKNIGGKIKQGLKLHKKHTDDLRGLIQNELSFDTICRKNISEWLKLEFKKEKGK